MVSIVTGYTMFVTLQFGVIFIFPNQRFGEFVDTACIFREAGAAVGQGERKRIKKFLRIMFVSVYQQR